MRVATRSLYQSMQQRIQQLSWDLKKLNEQIATGKKILRPSDDPLSLANAMQVKTAAAQLEQYSRNMESAKPWLTMAESALSQAIDLVGRTREIAVQMATSTQSAETRAMAAGEVPLRAPMPGMIISYNVKVGDKVATGDLVCVLEAMKMQNSLPAPASGTIKAINFEPGASVAKDAIILVIG